MNVHCVIVNWNGGPGNHACITSVLAAGIPEARIHFIDNGSTDGSTESVEDRHPALALVRTGENLGFGAAANIGVRNAIAAGAEAVLFMNNDALLDAAAVRSFEKAVAHAPRAGLYGPRVFMDARRDRLWCCGMDLGRGPNLARLRGHGTKASGRYLVEEEVDALTGCGLFVLRSVFETIGLFDEAWFVYVEDADFCARARKAGFTARYVPGAILEHSGAGSTGGGYGRARKYLSAHGSVLYLRRHGTARLWLNFWLCDVLAWPFVLVLEALRGRGKAAWWKGRGILDGLLKRPADLQRLGLR